MADEWIGIVESTTPRYMKMMSDETIRKRLLLAMAKKRGRIELNCSGTEMRWDLKFSIPAVSSYSDGGVLDFTNHNPVKQVGVDWRGYVATDTMSKKQRMMNKGNEAIINLFQEKTNNLRQTIEDNFAGELYRDGSATGREACIHGLETFMGYGACSSTDRIASPSDTYGITSLSTAPQAYGGTWSTDLTTKPNSTLATDWPDGNGSCEYDFASPKLVNYSASNWGTGATTWEANCWRVVSQTITWLTTTGGQDGMPSLCAMAPNLFQGYKNAQEVKTRIMIPHKESEDLGFGGVLNQDGVGIYSDFDCPVNTAYMLNLAHLTICSLHSELFWMDGPDTDPRTGWSYLWGIGFFGNVKYRPKHMAKIYPYA